MTVLDMARGRRQSAERCAGCRFPRASLAAFALVVAACAPHAPPTGAPAPALGPSKASAAGPSALIPPRYSIGHREYEITSVGLVSDAGDASGKLDTVTTTATLRYDARWDGPRLQIAGDVASRVVAASAGVRGTTSPTATTVPFRAAVDSATGMVTIDAASTPSGSSCPIGGPAVSQARSLATTFPRSLAPGASWRLTQADTSCLGGLPLVSTTLQTYTVAAQPSTDPVTGNAAVLVTHWSATTMTGGGTRGADTITLNGTGSGTTDQYYDRLTGQLLSARTKATLDLDVSVSGRVDRLHQQAEWQARKKN